MLRFCGAILQCYPAALLTRARWVAGAIATQPESKECESLASRVQQNAFEIQVERRLRYSEIDGKAFLGRLATRKPRITTGAERSVDFVDGNNSPSWRWLSTRPTSERRWKQQLVKTTSPAARPEQSAKRPAKIVFSMTSVGKSANRDQ
jgi:hypothetical protein